MKIATILPASTVIASLLGFSRMVSAAPPSPQSPTWVPEAMQSRVGLEFDWLNLTRDGTTTNALTWDLRAQLRVLPNIIFDCEISWAYVGMDAGVTTVRGGAFHVNVPSAGARYAALVGSDIGLFAGLALGLPVTGEGVPAQSTLRRVRGYQDAYRFSSQQVPLIVRLGGELQRSLFFLQAALAPSFLISFSSPKCDVNLGVPCETGDNPSVIYLDTSLAAGLRARFGLEGGVRLQATFILTSADDHAQAAIEPFIGYTSPSKVGVFARYGLLMMLDKDGQPDPYSGQGQDGFRPTHRLTVGAKF